MKLSSFAFAMLSALIAVAPFMPGAAAGDATDWAQIPSTKTWDYVDYRVERLSGLSTDLYKFGDTLTVVNHADSCMGACDYRDVNVLRNGGMFTISDVMLNGIDEQAYVSNENRLVYYEEVADQETHINVVEVDLDSGLKTNIVEDAFIGNLEQADVHVEDDMVYMTVEFDRTSDEVFEQQSTVFAFNPRFDQFLQVYKQYKVEREQVYDVNDEQLIVKMTFDGGEEQLWVYDYVEMGEQSAEPVPGTWTVPTEDMLFAHYTENGDIEFFRNYARHMTDGGLTNTESYEQYLDWFREYDANNLSNIIQLNGDYMAWLDPESDLYISNGSDVSYVANVSVFGEFELNDDFLLWSTGSAGGALDLASSETYSLGFNPTDQLGSMIVGVDQLGTVYSYNLETGKSLALGAGSTAYISDARHIYWVGQDGYLYEATLHLSTDLGSAGSLAVKSSTSPVVYMVQEDTLYKFDNEGVFYSWFDSFDEVLLVSDSYLDTFTDVQKATYRPGSRILIEGSVKVYTVADSGQLHWIIDEAVAESLYGETWNKNIVTVELDDVLDYSFGLSIDSEDDFSEDYIIALQ